MQIELSFLEKIVNTKKMPWPSDTGHNRHCVQNENVLPCLLSQAKVVCNFIHIT